MDFAAADADDEVTAGGEVKLLEAADFAVAAFAAKYLIVGSALRLLQALGDRGFDASAPELLVRIKSLEPSRSACLQRFFSSPLP